MKLPVSVKWLLMTLLFAPLVSWAQFSGSHDPLGSISGKILLAADNHPAQQVKVELRNFGGGWVGTTLTDWSGAFGFAGLPSGTYFVVVEEPGCEPIQETVQLDSGAGPLLLLHLNRTNLARPGEVGYVVSVRALSILPKARKAFQKGVQRLARNEPADSVAHFQRAIAEFPGYYEAYFKIGVAALMLGRDADAQQAFQKSIELSGGQYAEPQLALGLMLCSQEKFAEAEPIIRKGLERDQTSWAGYYSLAWALFGLNRLDEAEKTAREAVLRKADFAAAYLLLANIDIRQNNYSALLKDLDDYLKLDPDSATSAKAKAIRDDARRVLSRAHSASTLGQTKP